MPRTLMPLAAALLMLATQATHASDAALYDQPLPKDAVFLRWLQDDTPRHAFGASFDAATAPADAYLPVSAAALEGARPGAFYTVIDGQPVSEPARDDVSKVHLILLNAGAAPASLSVADADIDVIAQTAPRHAAARAVNPVAVELAVMVNGAELARLPVTLRRGQNVTVLVTDTGARLIEHRFAPLGQPD